jgi:LPXTG-motif cell wall-anchored protein
MLTCSLWLAMTWVTIALAQADGDADAGDADELSAGTLLLGVAVLAVAGWLAYRRRSTRSR